MKKKVMVAMSGGVDSSVAAALLMEQGYDVVGVTMKLRPDQYMVEGAKGGCCSLEDVNDARRVANHLGFPHYVFNLTDLFTKKVIDYFVEEYLRGRTPNPCIACNRFLKFDELLRRALSLNMDYVATGHYARIYHNEETGRHGLKKALCAKDQSYVLYNLTQHQLQHTLLPLGDFSKDQVREIARSLGLPVAEKADSQEICFVDNGDYAGFIERYKGKAAPEGFFVSTTGEVLGKHRGITHYTIGQRKGLGIALGRPMFVVEIKPEENIVVLGEEGESYFDELVAVDLNLIPFERLESEMEVEAKVRYQAKPERAAVYPFGEGAVRVKFERPQRAVTPGQAVVFYKGEEVLGGGTIASTSRAD